jgi:hypothetical protein
MGWTISFVMFEMSDITLLDPTLRSHVFDESEWQKIAVLGAQYPFEKGCVNTNKF